MGIGDPAGLLEVIERGIDLFDCVLPTRTARMGTAFTKEGRLNLKNARHARSTEPLDADCDCPACTGLHPRRPAALRAAEGDPGTAAPDGAQPALLVPLGGGRAGGYRRRKVRGLQGSMGCSVVTYALGLH